MIDPEGMIKDLRNLVKAQQELIDALYKRIEWYQSHDLILRDLDGDNVVELNLSKHKGEKLGDVIDKLGVEELLNTDTDGDKVFAPAPTISRKQWQTEAAMPESFILKETTGCVKISSCKDCNKYNTCKSYIE